MQQTQPQQPVTSGTSPNIHSQPPVSSIANQSLSTPSTGSQQHPSSLATVNSTAPTSQQSAQGVPAVPVPQNYPQSGPPPNQDFYSRSDQVKNLVVCLAQEKIYYSYGYIASIY